MNPFDQYPVPDLTEASLEEAMRRICEDLSGPIGPTTRWVSPDEWLEWHVGEQQPAGERWAYSVHRRLTWASGNMMWDEPLLLEPVPGGSFALLCAWLAQRAELNRQEVERLDGVRRRS